VGKSGHFQISATDIKSQTQIYPRTSSIEIRTPETAIPNLVINEFLASNVTINTDGAGEYDDWVELFNPTDTDLFLSGLYLSDNPENLTKWQFPFGGVILGAHEYLLIWCDEDQEQPGLHANFKLSAEGEFIALVAGDGVTIIDSLTFGPQSPDVSYGVWPDGSGTWQYLTSPTPGAPNGATAIKSNDAFPKKYALWQNYPNPFNAATIIRYDLPEHSHVEIVIYDLLGKEINHLLNQQQEPGTRSIIWNATDDLKRTVSTGVYLFQIKAEKFIQTRKMVFLK